METEIFLEKQKKGVLSTYNPFLKFLLETNQTDKIISNQTPVN